MPVDFATTMPRDPGATDDLGFGRSHVETPHPARAPGQLDASRRGISFATAKNSAIVPRGLTTALA